MMMMLLAQRQAEELRRRRRQLCDGGYKSSSSSSSSRIATIILDVIIIVARKQTYVLGVSMTLHCMQNKKNSKRKVSEISNSGERLRILMTCKEFGIEYAS